MWKKIKTIFEMIKFEHTVFALPFAFTGAILAAKGFPTMAKALWVLLAMVGARSGAMGLNRLVDIEMDALNPRTKDRAMPKGEVSIKEGWILIATSFLLLLLAGYNLNKLCFVLSPVALLVFGFYSYSKRFTWLSHLLLGVALAGAPIGGWIAVTGRLDLIPIILGVGVMFWVAGFDVIYACLDYEFDRQNKIYSIPAIFGIEKALQSAVIFHVVSVVFFVAVGLLMPLGIFYWIGIGLVVIALIYEHSIISPTDLSKTNVAFFKVNAVVSLIIFVFTLLDVARPFR